MIRHSQRGASTWGTRWILSLCGLLLAVHLSGPVCRASEKAVSGGKPLRVGVLPVTDVVPFYVAQEQNFFRDEKLAVDLVPVASAAERDQMMVTGQIDGQLNDLISTVLFNAEKTRITIVRKARCAFPDAPQIFILAAKNSKIQTPGDLKGVEIGISENSQIAYVIDRLLQREGFSKEEIRTVHVAQIPTRFQLLSQGQIQAAGLPDPLASLAILQGARRILDDSKHPEVSLSVISFRKEVVEGRAEDVRAFLRAYDRAIEAIRSHPDRFRNLLIEKARVPDPLKDRYPFPPFPDPSVPSPEQWGDVVQWAMEKGIVKGPVPYEGSVQQGFVK